MTKKHREHEDYDERFLRVLSLAARHDPTVLLRRFGSDVVRDVGAIVAFLEVLENFTQWDGQELRRRLGCRRELYTLPACSPIELQLSLEFLQVAVDLCEKLPTTEARDCRLIVDLLHHLFTSADGDLTKTRALLEQAHSALAAGDVPRAFLHALQDESLYSDLPLPPVEEDWGLAAASRAVAQ